jgi:hypothetical protein
MASTGQLSTQTPHWMHVSWSILNLGLPSEMASTGQVPLQTPQRVQASVITYAIDPAPSTYYYGTKVN